MLCEETVPLIEFAFVKNKEEYSISNPPSLLLWRDKHGIINDQWIE